MRRWITAVLTAGLLAPQLAVTAQALEREDLEAFVAALFHAARQGWRREPEPVDLTPTLVASGLQAPAFATAPPRDERLFIVERRGRIVILEGGVVRDTPFIDLRYRVGALRGETGLLGLAFDPEFRWNGLFYVFYTDSTPTTYVSRFELGSDPNQADPATEEVVLRIPQPFANHNGGTLAFGPHDDMLYVGLGDGGGANDPFGAAQNSFSLLGKMLRIDVSGGPGTTYTIPPDNPFVANAFVRDEIWALGLRNPYRFSFDSRTGDLWIGDVGQNRREEIDFEPAESAGGLNWGWDVREGRIGNNAGPTPPPYVNARPFAEPIHDYAHVGAACSGSVTGGSVYRGRVREFRGLYFFGDFCRGQMWTLDPDTEPPSVTEVTAELAPAAGTRGRIVSISEGGFRELYVVHANGDVYRLGPGGRECADGRDNDGDGRRDGQDPGCSSADDPSERDVDVACDDGFDNDWDGRIDYPHDRGCVGRTGDDEMERSPPHRPRPRTQLLRHHDRCGLGFEVALLLIPLQRLRRRRLR